MFFLFFSAGGFLGMLSVAYQKAIAGRNGNKPQIIEFAGTASILRFHIQRNSQMLDILRTDRRSIFMHTGNHQDVASRVSQNAYMNTHALQRCQFPLDALHICAKSIFEDFHVTTADTLKSRTAMFR